MFDANNAPQAAAWNFGYNAAPQMTYGGIAPQAMPKFRSTLTPEEIDQLQKKQGVFSLEITDEEHLKAVCNHRVADGSRDSLVQEPDGTVCCTICGYKFKPVSNTISKENIEDVCESITDILQTIKIMYQDFPADVARKYFDTIPLVNKIPQLFEFAAKNLQKYESMQNGYYMNNASVGAMTALHNLNNAFGFGGFAPQPMTAPTMGMPQPNPAFGQPAMMGNPFGYNGASQYTPAPAVNGFQFVPNQPQAPAAPAAPAAAPAPDVTIKQDVQA